MHKFASTRWRKVLDETIEKALNASSKVEFISAMRRLSKFQEAAAKGYLSQRYQEPYAKLWERYSGLVKKKGLELRPFGDVSNYAAGHFSPPRTIHLSDRDIFSLMHEFYEGLSFRKWKERIERLDPDLASFPFKEHRIMGEINAHFFEPFSHFRGTLGKERNFLRFMMLHPDESVQSRLLKVLVRRNAPVFLAKGTYKLGKQQKNIPRRLYSEFMLWRRIPPKATEINLTPDPRFAAPKTIEDVTMRTNNFMNKVLRGGRYLKGQQMRLAPEAPISLALARSLYAFDWEPRRTRQLKQIFTPRRPDFA